MARSLFILLVALQIGGPAAQASEQQNVDPALRSKAAAQAMNEGRFDEAAAIYRQLLEAVPNEPGLFMNLGMALAMGGKEAEAIAPLERALALNPKLLPAQLFLGSSYLSQGNAAKALAPLQRAVAGQPGDIESRRLLSRAYTALGRTADAVTELRKITEVAPKLPAGWYALGHGYNALTQDAIASFTDQPQEEPWRQLLLADALLADGRLTDAFALYRKSLEQLPGVVTIHDAVARIYVQTKHAEWAAVERAKGALPPTECARRKALCAFRAGQYRAALSAALGGTDAESRYFQARAATELALAAFARLDDLPESRERREVRATLARAERRYVDAIAELGAALKLAPGDPGLLDDLGTSYYFARDYERAVSTLAPLVTANPEDARLLTVYGDSLLQLQRVEEAIPLLQRAFERAPSDPMPRLALGRAYVQTGEFARAIPLIEPLLGQDQDGSLHVQLARAYNSVGQREKSTALLQRSQEIQQASQQAAADTSRRTITPPK